MPVNDADRLPFSPAIRTSQLLELGKDRGPYFVYDLAEIKTSFALLTRHFPGVQIYYAMKANPNPGILALMRELGARIEASSVGEVAKALEVGFAPAAITLTGPGKGVHDLAYAMLKGVGFVSVESLSEYRDLAMLCGARPSTISVLLRINDLGGQNGVGRPPAADGREFDAFPSQLGMEITEAAEIMREAQLAAPVAGIHLYNGSQVFDVSAFSERCRLLAASLDFLARESLKSLSMIQWGPGLGVPYGREQTALNLQSVAHAISRVLGDFRRSGGELALEVGRFLVARAGVYVSRIARIRHVGDQKVAVLEGGVHHFMRPSIATTGKHLVTALGKSAKSPLIAYSVVGPSGSPIDFFDRDVLLPELLPGDYLCFNNAGAYGKSMSLQGFISNPEADEILLDTSASR
jgi:diaminopimelate decarboxylase